MPCPQLSRAPYRPKFSCSTSTRFSCGATCADTAWPFSRKRISFLTSAFSQIASALSGSEVSRTPTAS